ncbi:MAG: ribosome biogenesis GTPase Der [Acidiferrobacteraceae bacterium]
MKPVVVLVGRPNVGKSTLFNALTRTRNALVADLPGLTRDRQYGEGRIGGRAYLVVDTGGLAEETDALRALSARQTRQAIVESDAVIFVVDGRTGRLAGDDEIADVLRRRNVPVAIAVNKAEAEDPISMAGDFHGLGFEAVFPVSAAHAQGLDALVGQVLKPFPPVPEEGADETAVRVAVIGRPNAGKSTLLNMMLGEDRLVVSAEPGTTRDSVEVPLSRNGHPYLFVDTAGVRRRGKVDDPIEKFSVVKTLQAIDRAHVVVLLVDAREQVGDQDVHLAAHVLEQGRALVLAINKWDIPTLSERAWVRREIERKLPFLAFAKPHFVSALTGMRVADLFPAIDRAFASARCVLPSPRLNKVLRRAVEAVPPPRAHGRPVRLKYAHQGGRNPPLIVVHGTQVDAVPDSYRRYLANVFRAAFKLEGTPIRIDLQSGSNPYAARRRH